MTGSLFPPSQAASDGDYPLNCWYVVATSDEIGPSLFAREVLGQRLALYRQRTGEIAALADRCAHRGAPLSMGSIVDDRVVCAYHGFTYSADGACVRVPSQLNPPYGARVRSFPIREKPPFVWVWTGDPGRSRGTEPPDVPELADAGWARFGGSKLIAANFMLLHDNALDRTHFPHVHPHRIHRGYVEDPPPLEIEVAETTVSYTRTFTPAPLAEWQQQATGLPADRLYTHRERGTFVSPALHVDEMDIIGPEPESRLFRGVFVRAFTPVDRVSTLVIWQAARNYGQSDASVAERLREVHEGTMIEDQPLLEAIQAKAADHLGRGINVAADAAASRAYEIVEMMLAEERAAGARPPGGRPDAAEPAPRR